MMALIASVQILSSSSSLSSLSPLGGLHFNTSIRKHHSCSALWIGACCQKYTSNDDGSLFSRREVVTGVNIAMLALGACDSLPAYAADLTQRIQRGNFLKVIKEKLAVAVKENPDLIPSFLKLALNDAATYMKSSKGGGANGSIRLSSELQRPENKGLDVAVKILEDLKVEIDGQSKGGPLSWADLIQFAGQATIKRTFLNAAIKKCGGNEEKGRTLYTAYGSNGQWGLFDKQFGRTDAQQPDPEGRVLWWEDAPTSEIKAAFEQLGLKSRQVAVMSAFLGPDQLGVEAKLATDPEIAPWVDKYQRSRETVSQTDYEVDLITTFTKLSTLGQTINYEAYTFRPPPLKIKL